MEIFFVRPHQEVNNNQLFFVLFKSFFDEKRPVFECFFVTIRKSAQILKKQNALIMSEYWQVTIQYSADVHFVFIISLSIICKKMQFNEQKVFFFALKISKIPALKCKETR